MRTKSSNITLSAIMLALCMAISSRFPLLSQSPCRDCAPPNTPSVSPFYVLIQEAKAADTEEGSQTYAKHLTGMFVASEMGDPFILEFSGRLAKADLMARQSKRAWVPESSVAQAFNDLMKQVTDPSSKPFQTDVAIVHQTRLETDSMLHPLTSVASHNSECLPSEAVFVLTELVGKNGTLGLPDPSHYPSPNIHVTGGALNMHADFVISHYIISHSHSKTVKLYNHVAQVLGF